MIEPRYLLIVKVRNGLWIRDTPRPKGQGGADMRVVAVGKPLYAYNIINIDGVPYARLVPQNPLKPEWVRVAEADHSIEYVDVIDLASENEDTLAKSIAALAASITLLALEVRKNTEKK